MTITIATAFFRLVSVSFFAVILAATGIASAAETYRFDKRHTEIRFSWDHFGLSRMSGRILEYEGALRFDQAAPEKSALNVKLHTKSLWTHSDELNKRLKGPEFFNVSAHPEIIFKTTKVVKTGETSAKIHGDLTIKGITRPVILDATLNFNGPHPIAGIPSLGVSATTAVKRSEFGIDKYTPAVSDEIDIAIETEMNLDD